MPEVADGKFASGSNASNYDHDVCGKDQFEGEGSGLPEQSQETNDSIESWND